MTRAEGLHLRWVPLGIVIGALSGISAILLYGSIKLATRWFLGPVGYRPATIAADPGGFVQATGFRLPWAIPLLVAAGALVGGMLTHWFAPETQGHGTDVAIRAINTDPTGMRPRALPMKMLASALTIGSGGSGGTEGPTAQMAAVAASVIVGRRGLDYKQARMMVVAGLAAGVAAIFRAPLGGAILSVELLYRRDREWRMLLPAMVASAVSYVEFSAVYGWSPMLGHVPGTALTAPAQLLIFPVLGLICGGLARLYAFTFYRVESLSQRWRTWPPLRPCVAGLCTGVLGLMVPGALGTGYGTIQDVLSGQRVLQLSLLVLIAMPFAKILATSASIGSGGSGGVFGPGMVVGATAGAALWRLAGLAGAHAIVPASPALLAAVGMAACLGAAARSPLAITVIAAEACASWWVFPAAILAVPISVLLMGDDTLYRAQPRDRAELSEQRSGLDAPVPVPPQPGPAPVPPEPLKTPEAPKTPEPERQPVSADANVSDDAKRLVNPARSHRDALG
jgi:chloride channel protein, CIC family